MKTMQQQLPPRHPRLIKWNLPAGFILGKEPSRLGDTLVGQWVLPYFCGEAYTGSRLAARLHASMETSITKAFHPRLFREVYTFRIKTQVDRQLEGARLTVKLDNYMHMEKMLLLTHMGVAPCLCAQGRYQAAGSRLVNDRVVARRPAR